MTDVCPKCSSRAIKKNGFTRHGKQNHRCLECGRQFSFELEVNVILAPAHANDVKILDENTQKIKE